LHDIAREIELIAGIRKAREEAARGEGVSPEKAKQLVDSWASR
jgi:predicted transcriptional regulator